MAPIGPSWMFIVYPYMNRETANDHRVYVPWFLHESFVFSINLLPLQHSCENANILYCAYCPFREITPRMEEFI